MPKEISLEMLMARDRYWFEKHPDHNSYIREYIKGEFPVEVKPTPRYVLVTQIGLGLRSRMTLVDLPDEWRESEVNHSIVGEDEPRNCSRRIAL